MRTVALPLFSSLIALLAVGAWQVGGCRAQQAQHREEFLEQGQALLAAAEGLVARETRGGMVDPAALQETLDHARDTFGLEGVRVVTVAGEVSAESGLVVETEAAGQRFEKTMEVLRPRHEGRGPPWGQGPGRRRLEGDALTLMLWLPMDELQVRLAQDAFRATITALALGLTILLFGGVELVITCGDVVIDADREQLRRLLPNLLLNALQALESGGSITLACRSTGNGVALSVEDDGCGIPEALRETLFEPYVSQREGGSGLGLSIASRIAVDHGFVLWHEPNPPKGTRMILEVPRP